MQEPERKIVATADPEGDSSIFCNIIARMIAKAMIEAERAEEASEKEKSA